MQEKLIEQKLVVEVKKLGGLCPKFTSLLQKERLMSR